MTYCVKLTDQTRDAIFEQVKYIALDCQSPENAQNWLNGVMDAIGSLEHWPRRCSLAIENDYRPYEIRKMQVMNCLLLFTVDDEEKIVWVVGFRHGRMLPRLAELPGDLLSGQ